jgi:hypothetical protein
MTYADGSRFEGEIANGERHGFGVSFFTDDYKNKCRYEGSWRHDKRDGYGLLLGGAYRFCFGTYQAGVPVGTHAAWDYHTSHVELLRF